MSEAGVYRCPSCGAPADPKAAACAFCRAALHPVRCPWCFEWTDESAKGCPRCGASAVSASEGSGALKCPTCRRSPLSTRGLGGARLSGCAACGGVWADAASFRKLCEDRATQTAYLGEGAAIERPKPSDPSVDAVLYRPCAVCGELMNRLNFAGCSGVILDACKPHGVWFDPDELRRIVEFIRGGGLDLARSKEIARLELERRRLEKIAQDMQKPMSGFQPPVPDGIAAARGLLGYLFDLMI